MPFPKLSDWVKMKKVKHFAVPRSFLPELQFLFFGRWKRYIPTIFWIFWTMEHPERGKIVDLLSAWFEQILGDETNHFSSSADFFKHM